MRDKLPEWQVEKRAQETVGPNKNIPIPHSEPGGPWVGRKAKGTGEAGKHAFIEAAATHSGMPS